MSAATSGPSAQRFSSTTLAHALLVPVAYVAGLGWHALAQASAYPEWRVVGLAVTWAALVVVGASRGSPTSAGVTGVVALVVVWCADATTTPRDDASLWPIGAVFLLVGAAAAAAALVGVTTGVRALARRARR